jgi:hypothetical protein
MSTTAKKVFNIETRSFDGQPVWRIPVRAVSAEYSGRFDDRAEETGQVGSRPPQDVVAGRRQSRDHQSSRLVERRLSAARIFVEKPVDVVGGDVGRRPAQPVAQDVDDDEQQRRFSKPVDESVENSVRVLCL